MSTAIRPPGGPGSMRGPAELDGSGEVDASIAPGDVVETERAAATGGAAASAAVGTKQTAVVDNPTALVLSRLDAGEISREQAIDSLVAEAVATHGATRLPPLQRAELEGIMRAALLEDPTLARLLG
jgi:hypothetical protein